MTVSVISNRLSFDLCQCRESDFDALLSCSDLQERSSSVAAVVEFDDEAVKRVNFSGDVTPVSKKRRLLPSQTSVGDPGATPQYR